MAKVKPITNKIHKLKLTDIGKMFTKKELGVKFPQALNAPAKSKRGQDVLFLTINNENIYKNELHSDGVVIQPINVAKHKAGTTKNSDNYVDFHILVRWCIKGQAAFEYIGTCAKMKKYDKKRFKLFVLPQLKSAKKVKPQRAQSPQRK